MKSLSRLAVGALTLTAILPLIGCTHAEDGRAARPPLPARAADLTIASPPGTVRPPFTFSPEDERLLDEVQYGCFKYFWEAVNPVSGMVPDRSSVTFVSIAGVGFQLSALPIGVERGWITREQGAARAVLILRTLLSRTDNRHEGLFQHFLDGDTAAPRSDSPEHVVSTIDSALLFAGALTAGQYFGGESLALANQMIEAANWRAFVSGDEAKPHERGFISLGWKPKDPKNTTGPGSYLPYYWADSGCEHRLVTFMGVLSPREAHRVDPAMYYRLRRAVGDYQGTGPMVWFPFSGALFVNIFSHCWIDYAGMGADAPAQAGIANRSPVDWWENSRRTVALHRLKARENPKRVPTLGEHAWGLSAMDVAKGYAVPGVYPTLITFADQRAEFDYSTFTPKDDYGDGTIAPYAPGAAIMFEPRAAIDAMRFAQVQKATDGRPLAWRDPRAPGPHQFGFQDSFNLGTGWVAPDCVAIDQGPLILAIENARSGLIWRTFHAHPWVREAGARLGWHEPRR